MNVCGKDIYIEGRVVRIARLAAEGFEFLEDPEAAVKVLRESRSGIDLFSFRRPLSQTSPQYGYPVEWDNVAGLPVSTFENWWKRQIDGKTRNMVRRAEKKGVVIREVPFDDVLVRGIWEIYNECPIRQGRRFLHYGKDLETVHRVSATFLERSFFIGAFDGEKLIGFMKLTADDARSQAAVMHIIGMIQHRDKAPANALVAQAVRSCSERGIPYLVYSNFAYGKKERDSLADFKESNGFQRIDVPRYYVALTRKGRLALRWGLHHSLLGRIPEPVTAKLRQLRSSWYARRFRAAPGTS